MLAIGILLAAGLLATAPQPSACADSWFHGPLSVHSPAPLYATRLAYTSGRVLPLPRGDLELLLSGNQANIWGPMDTFFLDGEWTRANLRVAYGLVDGLELWGEVPVLSRGGGWMDTLIETFHASLGLNSAQRERTPRDRLRVDVAALRPRQPPFVLGRQRHTGLGNPSLGGKLRLGGSANPAFPSLVLETAWQLPWGDLAGHLASGSRAGLLNLTVQQPLGTHLLLYAAAGVLVLLTADRVYSIELSRAQRFFMLGFELHLLQGLNFVATYVNQDGAARSPLYSPLNLPTHEFTAGLSWMPWQGGPWLFELGVLENAIHYANTADFGIHAGLRWRRPGLTH